MPARWEPGQLIVRREVLGLGHDFHPSPRPNWYGRAWEALPVLFTAELVDWIRRTGDDIVHRLDAGELWWDPAWSAWEPDPSWKDTRLPDGWADR